MTAPGGTREIRGSASELKFLVDSETGQRIREEVRSWLAPDPYASGPTADEYFTTTLYFDTPEFDTYERRGSYRRAKYRIRRYGQGELVFLERKLRTADVLTKRRTTVHLGELPFLATDNLDLSVGWAGAWFHERLLMRRLKAVCQVSYRRTARVGMTDNGPIRLTVDDDLRGVRVDSVAFVPGERSRPVTDRTIVELKFTGPIPAIFKRVVETFALEQLRVSKYRLGIEATRQEDATTHA